MVTNGWRVIPRRSGGDVSLTVILEVQDAIEKYDRAMQLMPERGLGHQ
jgi:hypothetical protein